MDAAELAAQRRVVGEVAERVLAGRVVDGAGHLLVVEHFEVGLEQLVVEELVAVAAGELHAHHAQLAQAALQLVDVLLAAPRRQHGIGVQTPLRLAAHLGGLVVHDPAHVERQPFLPHRHAQKRDVNAHLVHGAQLRLQRVVALHVVQDVLAVLGGQHDLVLGAVGRLAAVGLEPHGDGGGVQKAVEHLLVREQVGGQEVHVDVDDLVVSHVLSFWLTGARPASPGRAAGRGTGSPPGFTGRSA